MLTDIEYVSFLWPEQIAMLLSALLVFPPLLKTAAFLPKIQEQGES